MSPSSGSFEGLPLDLARALATKPLSPCQQRILRRLRLDGSATVNGNAGKALKRLADLGLITARSIPSPFAAEIIRVDPTPRGSALIAAVSPEKGQGRTELNYCTGCARETPRDFCPRCGRTFDGGPDDRDRRFSREAN